ncbi:MAG TPA: adenosylcobinamide-GDP ribazoletransferase [Roseiflexaceae bacterium]|nr:adenosylcobinamide-GDP ribazoletransferase [Roseiflexaceae bacterium]
MSQSPPVEPDTNEPSDSLWRRLIGALRFLTIVRMPASWATTDPPLAKSLAFFPLIGLIIGALLLSIGMLAGWFWGGGVRAVAVVVAWGVITGGLHLDGLSDTFDGVMSWRPRERKLEIMRDSRVGVMGVLALAAIVGLKVALLFGTDEWVPALLLAPALGRWAICYGLGRFPAARADGLGAMAQVQTSSGLVFAPTVIVIIAALLIAGLRGAVALALVWLAARTLARWWTRDLGGLTGDTYGALCEIAEVVALAALTARIS